MDKGFAAYETVRIVLPSIYKCKNCQRLVRCIRQPEACVCCKCRGVEPYYEKIQDPLEDEHAHT